MTASRLTLLSIVVLSSVVGCAGSPRLHASAGPDGAVRPNPAAARAAFKGRMEIGTDRQRFEGTLAFVRPDRLFVEIGGPVGGTRAEMAARDGRILVLLPASREFIDEPADPATYEYLLGLPLDTAGLIELIQLGLDSSCSAPCARELPLAPDERGTARLLRMSKREDLVTAGIEPADGVTGFRVLELRLRDAIFPGPEGVDPAIFSPVIPDGFARLLPGAARGPATLLRPR